MKKNIKTISHFWMFSVALVLFFFAACQKEDLKNQVSLGLKLQQQFLF